jgi:hypothetical protein
VETKQKEKEGEKIKRKVGSNFGAKLKHESGLQPKVKLATTLL